MEHETPKRAYSEGPFSLGIPSKYAQTLERVYSERSFAWGIPSYFPRPQITELKTTAYIDISTDKIRISKSFVDELSKRIDVDTIFKGVLAHEYYHWDFFPWSSDISRRVYAKAEELAGKKKGHSLGNYFADVFVNLKATVERGDCVLDIYDAIDKVHPLDTLLSAFYFRVFNMEPSTDAKGNADVLDLLHGEGDPVLQGKIEQLRGINWQSKYQWSTKLEEFYSIIKDLLDLPPQHGGGLGGQGDGQDGQEQQPGDGDVVTPVFGDFPVEVLEGKEAGDKHKRGEESFKDLSSGPARLAGEFSMSIPDVYLEASKRYRIPLPRIEKVGISSMKLGHQDWVTCRPVQNIDPLASLSPQGKIMPGLTKEHRYSPGEIYTGKTSTPNGLILLDSSGSMTDPSGNAKNSRDAWSMAAFAGIVFARSLIGAGSTVQVVNFSDITQAYPPTKNLRKAAEHITAYQGGGTAVILDTVKSVGEQFGKQGPYMTLLISDMGINSEENKAEVFDFIALDPSAMFIHICSTQTPEGEALQARAPGRYFMVGKNDDLGKIVLDNIRKAGFK